MPAYEISTFLFIHVYYPSLLLSVPVKSGLAHHSVLSNPFPLPKALCIRCPNTVIFLKKTVFCRFQMTMQRPRGRLALGRAWGSAFTAQAWRGWGYPELVVHTLHIV